MDKKKKKTVFLLCILFVVIVTAVLLLVISSKTGLLLQQANKNQDTDLTSISEYDYNSTIDNYQKETAETQLSVETEIEENCNTTYTPNE